MSLKLSEAIRLGSMATTQVIGFLDDGRGGACAMGAALIAVGQLAETRTPKHLNALFPICALDVEHPMYFDRENLARVIINLNDGHYWTREAIADFVASIEQQQETAPASEAPDEAMQLVRAKAI